MSIKQPPSEGKNLSAETLSRLVLRGHLPLGLVVTGLGHWRDPASQQPPGAVFPWWSSNIHAWRQGFFWKKFCSKLNSQQPISDANSTCCCGNQQSVLLCAEMRSGFFSHVSTASSLLSPTSTHIFLLLLFKTERLCREGKSFGILSIEVLSRTAWHPVCI